MDSDYDDEVMYDDENYSDEESQPISTVSPTDSERGKASENYPFEILSTDEVVQHMTSIVDDVNTVLVDIPAPVTRMLLNHFKWDKEKLMERYYDGDQDKLFAEARVVNPFHMEKIVPARSANTLTQKSTNDTEDCMICLSALPFNLMTGLDCGHRFCKDCWAQYLKIKIMDEGECQTIKCADHECRILVDDATVTSLISEPEVRTKYQQLITNSFVECNKQLRWCPSPGCKSVVKVQYVDWKPVTCKCDHTFCLKCSESWHDPVQCGLLKTWIKKCTDDSETCNWLALNTKECPKCSAVIEKNGGCNHITCKNVNCRQEFCWVCTRSWDEHVGGGNAYSCNRYDGEDRMVAKEQSRAALQRYLHYCNRYLNHLRSLKFEKELYDKVEQKMEELQMMGLMTWIEVRFLKKAVDALCSCRQVLMYTYAFAYYLKKNNHQIIFENNQSDLESSTETLSGYLERDLLLENPDVIKQKVQDLHRYCESRRAKLLEQVHEGYENDCWEYLY